MAELQGWLSQRKSVQQWDMDRRFRRSAWDLAMGSLVGLLSGTASALFLFLLGKSILLQERHAWLLFCLPAFGMASAWLYRRFGQEVERGGALILDEVLEFQGKVTPIMAPLVLMGTLLAHLGGASAGREGTAVQMGASLAASLGKLPLSWLRLTRTRQRLLLMAGISAGFGSLFGTPVAGAIFGMEVIAIGKIHYEGLLICGAASVVGDLVCRGLGAHHSHFHPAAMGMTLFTACKLAFFALPVALAAGAFSESTHALAKYTKERWNPYLRAIIGGCAIIALALLLGRDYLNLGTQWLPRVFEESPAVPLVPPWAFALKLLFTCVTLGCGFKGGEVTPLFVSGALLGAAMAPLLGLPAPFLAAVGFIALFSSASNTPIASLAMGVELFGGEFCAPLMITGFLAYVLVGHRGIYGGQRVQTRK